MASCRNPAWAAPMSSGHDERVSPGCLRGVIVAHPTKDLVADPAAKSPDGFCLRVAGEPAVIDVLATRAGPLHLGDGDPVEGEVELAVATPTETVTDDIARPDRHRCRAVVTGERGLRVEARDAGRLADQLGRRERTAAGQRQQIRTEALDQA